MGLLLLYWDFIHVVWQAMVATVFVVGTFTVFTVVYTEKRKGDITEEVTHSLMKPLTLSLAFLVSGVVGYIIMIFAGDRDPTRSGKIIMMILTGVPLAVGWYYSITNLSKAYAVAPRVFYNLWAYLNKDKINALPDDYNALYELVDFKNALKVPEPLREILVTNYGHWLLEQGGATKANIKEKWAKATPEEREKLFAGPPNVLGHAQAVNHLMELVPAKGLLTKGENNLYDYILPTMQKAEHDDDAHAYFLSLHNLGDYREAFKQIKVGTVIPDRMRVEHMQVLAGSGHGKTTLFTQMFFEDLKSDAGIVLIDSQGDLINELAARVPADRLILVDPETCPPALNMFATKIQGEQGINNALSLFEYIFGSLGVALTGQQEMVYRYLSRLCMMIPGGSINTLRDMLQPGGTEQYLPYIQQMNENAQAFFRSFEQEKNNAFKETRQAVLNRLLKVLESETFASMLGADRMALDIPKALSEGKVILVSTAKDFLGDGASLLGRIFVAQVMQAVRSRGPNERKRVYLYIDEFADYAEDSKILFDCFAQGRKYELGMIIAHQDYERISSTLSAVISTNTAIKFAGGLSAEDSRRMGGQMRVDYREIDRQPKGTFLAYFKDIGTIPWRVKFGFINTVPVVNNIYEIHEKMRELYGPTEKKQPTPPPEPPRDDTGEDAW